MLLDSKFNPTVKTVVADLDLVLAGLFFRQRSIAVAAQKFTALGAAPDLMSMQHCRRAFLDPHNLKLNEGK
jgi:hypothetical protein